MKNHLAPCVLSLLAAATLAAAPATLTVQVDQPGHKVAPTLWGIFFEDINLSADGGIYPELVRNRSFEDSERQADHWKLIQAEGGKSELHGSHGFSLEGLQSNLPG